MTTSLHVICHKLREEGSSLANGALIAISFAIVIVMYVMTIHYGMHLNTQESLHLYFAKYVAAAISSIEHNLHGFVGYNNIYNVVFQPGNIDDNVLNAAVAVKDFASNGIFTIVGVDLGYYTFAKLAFLLFGYRVISFLHLFFLVLSISIIGYIVEFWKSRLALSLLVAFLLSFYLVALRCVDMPINVAVIYGYRFMSLLAILPLLHILLFIYTGKSLHSNNMLSCFLLIIQSSLIVWMYYVRASTQWMFIALFAFLLLNLVFVWFKSKPIQVRDLTNSSLPILILFSVLIISKIAMLYAYNDAYQHQKDKAHVFWHSIYVGLALHPEIRKEYTDERPPASGSRDSWFERSRYRPNDQDALSATLRWLHQAGRNEYTVFNFKEIDRVAYCSAFTYPWDAGRCSSTSTTDSRIFNWETDFNYFVHDRVLKEVVFHIVENKPLQVLQVIFIIKPLKLIHMYYYDYLKIHELTHPKLYFESLVARIPFIFSLLVTLLILGFLMKAVKCNLNSLAIPIAVVSLFAMIPPLAADPQLWSFADAALLLTIAIYLMLVELVKTIVPNCVDLATKFRNS